MARGTVVGEAVVSQANTPAYRAEHERLFGDKKPQRGRWVWDEQAQRLVSADEYQPPVAAKNAPIMVDRFMEGAQATDGTDIGSRAKRREYMRREGVTDTSDYKPGYADRRRAEAERAVAENTKRTVATLANIDPRHVRKYLEEKK